VSRIPSTGARGGTTGPGATLSEGFYAEVVSPLLARHLPRLAHAAGRFGSGSDVLGLDDAMSRDHDWGCRLALLVDQADVAVVPDLVRMLGQELPETYRGHPVRFPTTWSSEATHQVQTDTVAGFAASRLGVPVLGGFSVVDWLTLTGHAVLEVTAGPIFADTTRELAPLRETLTWYPDDLDRYVLASAWSRLGERLPLVGRTAQRGDELGSRLLAAGLARDVMRLTFLLARTWAPYDKWLGTVFATLPLGVDLSAPLELATRGESWQERERGLTEAADVLLAAQRSRGLPCPSTAVVPFFDRPFQMIDPEVWALLRAGLTDPVVAALPSGVGSIEQWVDADDVLARPERRHAVTAAYRSWLGASSGI
jgi:Domain of unknown function (DUF4037)